MCDVRDGPPAAATRARPPSRVAAPRRRGRGLALSAAEAGPLAGRGERPADADGRALLLQDSQRR